MALSNGGFESGDLTGWTDEGSTEGDSCTQSTTVTTGSKRSGTYGCVQSIVAADGDDNPIAMISRTILADFFSFSLWYKVDHALKSDGEFGISFSLLDSEDVLYDYAFHYTGLTEGDWQNIIILKDDFELDGGSWEATTKIKIWTKVQIIG